MIWDKVGFVLASKQRTEVFRLAIRGNGNKKKRLKTFICFP
jgi:hypothetical protein